jgi:hypothetical protein
MPFGTKEFMKLMNLAIWYKDFLQKKILVLIKFDTAHMFIPPAIQRKGVYSIWPLVRECFPHCLFNSSLTTEGGGGDLGFFLYEKGSKGKRVLLQNM